MGSTGFIASAPTRATTAPGPLAPQADNSGGHAGVLQVPAGAAEGYHSCMNSTLRLAEGKENASRSAGPRGRCCKGGLDDFLGMLPFKSPHPAVPWPGITFSDHGSALGC
eukprot:1151362-Pelagomonas_calceolata.AAC.2